jgi:mono/diheme cytochrome c family protein
MRVLPTLIGAVVVAGVAMASLAGQRHVTDPRTLPGWATYERSCAPCHGTAGDGHGPAAPFTRGGPRAFAKGEYEWRSTAIGQPPTDDDLRTAIRFGAPGTSMPAFGGVLDASEIDRVIDVVKAFSPASFTSGAKPIALAAARGADPARGAQLWTQLGCDRCHGAAGHGDGAAGKSLPEPPYDLAAGVRRPRTSDELADRRRAAALSIATGMTGTAMPAYAGQIPDADVWALADHVLALADHRKPSPPILDELTIAADRGTPITAGTWPGTDAEEARVFGQPVPPQGTPPPSLGPAQASLHARQCARCHAKQFREWQVSLHAQTTALGFPARVHGLPGDDAASCAHCHAPLAEQSPGPGYDADLHTEGVTCAGCHVRGWVRRGPPRLAPSLAPATGYPLVELGLYERADMCMPCHQLPPRTAVAGKPLLDTYREWLEGPYMKRGIQCQHCHMSNREHTWLGVHDRETFRQGIRLDASAHRDRAGAISVLAELRNVGAGHDLPTTATPAAWLRIELFDAHNLPIEGARSELRIGRDVVYGEHGWTERADTRIPPGESRSLARAWSGGRTGDATFARVTVEVHPDDYYERLYAAQLATKLPADERTLYEQAAVRARGSRYIAEQRDVKIELSSKQ